MSNLIVTEKPSFAKALGVAKPYDRNLEVLTEPIDEAKYPVSWCIGHLVEQLRQARERTQKQDKASREEQEQKTER